MWPRTGWRHRRHVPRVQGPFVAPQGLGAKPVIELPEPILGEVPISGLSAGFGADTAESSVKLAFGGTSTGSSITGDPVFPDAATFPSTGLFPGSSGADLLLVTDDQFGRPMADVSAGGWTATPLWSKLDEVTMDDADFVTGVGV